MDKKECNQALRGLVQKHPVDFPKSGHVAQQNFHHGTIFFGPGERFSSTTEFIGVMFFRAVGATVKKGTEPWVNATALAVWIYTASCCFQKTMTPHSGSL